MGNITKNVKVTSDEQLEIPDSLLRTQKNYKKAQFEYTFDENDESYIEYNTLRQKRLDTEEITVVKISRLFDRDQEKESIIYYQKSRVKDFNNNYKECPITELIGVVPKPISNVSNDAQNRIQDIKIVETQNDYYIPFSKEKLIELFEVSKDKHKIVCYVGYTRPTRVKNYDIIDNKKIIWNQDRFVNAGYNELIDKEEDNQKVLDTRKAYVIPNKIRDVNKQQSKSQRVETLAELTKDLDTSKLWKSNKKETKEDKNLIDTEKEFKELNS